MKVLKIIFAILIAYSAIKALVIMAPKEHGAGMVGVLIAFFVLIALSIYLFYSALRKKNK
jgi:hypothetical protein